VTSNEFTNVQYPEADKMCRIESLYCALRQALQGEVLYDANTLLHFWSA